MPGSYSRSLKNLDQEYMDSDEQIYRDIEIHCNMISDMPESELLIRKEIEFFRYLSIDRVIQAFNRNVSYKNRMLHYKDLLLNEVSDNRLRTILHNFNP